MAETLRAKKMLDNLLGAYCDIEKGDERANAVFATAEQQALNSKDNRQIVLWKRRASEKARLEADIAHADSIGIESLLAKNMVRLHPSCIEWLHVVFIQND